MPIATNTNDARYSQKNEVLLQVQTLDLGNLRKSFREKPLNTDEKLDKLVEHNISEKMDSNENEELNNGEKKKDKNKKRDKEKRKGDTTKSYFQNFMAEVIGTALLMFLGCMGCIPQVDSPPAVHHMSSFSFGMVVLCIIQIFGHVSGAHLNPAVTIGTVIFKMLSPLMGLVYVIAQFIGALLGFGLLKILIPKEWAVDGFCATRPHEKTTPFQALAIETIITCVLLLVCCGVWDKRNEQKQDSTPARFGFIIAAISMVAGPLTGASMNTARSFPPAFYDGNFTHNWIYWIGPNMGAILGCGLYQYLFSFEENTEDQQEDKEHQEVNHHMLSEKA